MTNQNVMTMCQCDNCSKIHSADQVLEAKDLDQRLDYPIGHPDCKEPSGECPDCGALCYPVKPVALSTWDVTVHYQTHGGAAGARTIRGIRAADEDEAIEKANAAVRRDPRVAKIHGGDVETASEREDQQVYLVIQEGGSSTELYLRAHASRELAEEDRIRCAAGAFRTSPVVAIPRAVADTPGFLEAVEMALLAHQGLEMADTPVKPADKARFR